MGKSYLGCALGNKACRDGYRVRYWSTPKLLRELSTASADGSLARLLKHLARTDLLILDDWGLERLKDAHAQLLLEIVEDRQETGSVLITSQFAVGSWHELHRQPHRRRRPAGSARPQRPPDRTERRVHAQDEDRTHPRQNLNHGYH